MTTLQLIKKLVSIPSSFPDEKEIADFLTEYLKDLGFRVQKVKTSSTRYNIVATYGVAKKYLAFYGHMDTVPNNFSERKYPYTLHIDGDIARGLGAEDMKGGIAAILQTAAFAVENKYPLRVIFCCDEEDISQGAHDVVNSGLVNDIGFLVAGESGQVPDHAKSFTSCFGRKGRILFEAEIRGKKTHAAESEKGVNAIEHAAELIQIFKKMKFPKHPRLGQTRIVAHSLHSETDSFAIPDRAVLQFSLLTTPGVTSTQFLKDVTGLVKAKKIDASIAVVSRKTPYGESYEVDRKNRFLQVIKKEVLEKHHVSPMYTTSVADENVFANRLKIPVISLGPLGGGGHTSSEWLNLNSLLLVEEVYKNILELFVLQNRNGIKKSLS